jgi:PAS domain S-box-containing protein
MPWKDTGRYDELQILEALTEAVYIIDADGRIQFCNHALEQLTGYAASTLLGRPSLNLYAPEDRPAVLNRRTLAFRGERVPSLLNTTLVRHDGARLPVELTLSSLTREGQVVGRMTVLRDISARQRGLAVLQASEERFRLLVEGVQDYAIYLLDPEGRVTTWNTGAQRIKGYTAADILGESFSRFFPPNELARGTPAALLEQATRDGHYVGEGWRVRKDGSQFWASVVITALWDAHGQVRGFAKVTRDITERREAEQALAQANEDLEHRVAERTAALQASLQEKEVLLKEIHHRVKNNLQVITSLLSLQHAAIDDPHTRALFEESERRIGAMALVHETLYQTGDLGRFDLAQYIPTLSTQLLHAYGVDPQRVAVHLALAEVTLPLDMAVPCGLILHKLLSNGLQHAFPDGQTGTITVTLTHAADRVTLTVHDDGCGVPVALDVHHTESLGLLLVDALAVQLDGTVALERAGGTAFTVTFPLPNGPRSDEPSADSFSGGGLHG